MTQSDYQLLSPFVEIGTEVIQCMTTQWNFPHDRFQPWSRDGICSICGQQVETDRVGPDQPNTFSHIAKPHERRRRLFLINEDDLLGLLRYQQQW